MWVATIKKSRTVITILVVASISAGLLLIKQSKTNPLADALSSPGWPYAKGNDQDYLRNETLTVSTSSLPNVSKRDVRLISAVPSYSSSCSVHFGRTVAYWVGDGKGSVGWVATSASPLTDLGYPPGKAFSSVVMRPSYPWDQYFGNLTFEVRGFCKVKFKGFTIRYRVGNQVFNWFDHQSSVFTPVSKFPR